MNDKELFRSFWKNLSRREKMELRKRILNECHILYPTLRNWLQGTSRIPPLAKEKIEKITGAKIFTDEV
jgi:hypothetical protein